MSKYFGYSVEGQPKPIKRPDIFFSKLLIDNSSFSLRVISLILLDSTFRPLSSTVLLLSSAGPFGASRLSGEAALLHQQTGSINTHTNILAHLENLNSAPKHDTRRISGKTGGRIGVALQALLKLLTGQTGFLSVVVAALAQYGCIYETLKV